jgi:sugar lactone lactonase YvrE
MHSTGALHGLNISFQYNKRYIKIPGTTYHPSIIILRTTWWFEPGLKGWCVEMKPIKVLQGVAVLLLILVLVQGVQAAETYKYVTQWGSLGTDNLQFDYPEGVAVDLSRNIYVVDTVNNRIQKLDDGGNYLTQWGSSGKGDEQFNWPKLAATDTSGNVYVADQVNNRIQKFDSGGKFLTKWGYQGTDSGNFSYPTGITIDPSGNVYVADRLNQRIQKFDLDGNYLKQWPIADWGTIPGPHYVWGIAADASGNVYVAETGNNDRILKFDSDGNYLLQWGSYGSGNTQFNYPTGVAVDKLGNVYVSDKDNNRIQKFKSDGTYVTQWGSQGSGNSQFDNPEGIAVDTSGNVYVADPGNNRIQEFALDQAPGTGSILVTSSPPGAEIWINSADTGQKTPAVFSGKDPGSYLVTVIKSGYVTPATRTVTVTAGQETDVNFALDEGSLYVTSVPDGAEVIIDGADAGQTTNWTFTAHEGSHSVAVSKAGYITPDPKTVTVTGMLQTEVDFALDPIPVSTGVLRVTSDTKGAEIFINSADTHEITDHSFTGETPGSYTVYVTLSGYDTPATKTVTVTAGQETDVDFTLVKTPPLTGVLKVISDTKGAEIFINSADTHEVTDHSFTGETPGSYTVYVTLSGYDTPATKTVTVTAGQETDVDFTLVKTPPFPTTGSIEVTAYPSGTQIWLDGVSQGYYYTGQVVTITGVSPGTHLIYGSYHDYANAPSVYWYQSSDPHVSVSAGQTTKYMLEMYMATPGMPGSVSVSAKCPVDLTITNPSGKVISKTADEIPGAIYTQPNVDADGFRDVLVAFQDEIPGYYHVAVTPKTGALPTDTYTLTAWSPQKTVTLADKIPVSNIPEKGYVFFLAADGSITIVPGGIPTPEFPSAALPVLFSIGFLGAAAYIRSTREN